jgi:hypothetical protein
MSKIDAARTNLKYPPCCYGEFDCIDKGKGCVHKNNCKNQRKEGEIRKDEREKVLDELEEKRLKYEQNLQQLTSCFDEYDRGLIEGKECFVIILKEWIKELRGEQ